MELITVNKKIEEYSKQLDFLIRLEFRITYSPIRRLPLYLLIWVLLILGLIFFTGSESFITLKVVGISLTFIVVPAGVLIAVPIVWKYYKRKQWKRKSIKCELADNTEHQMAFDKEKLFFSTSKDQYEIEWKVFGFYALYKRSIFLIPADNIYSATCISELEIGAETFNHLKAIAEEKLSLV
ncbi:hypothetical protein [Ferruginibacter sp. SUN106]|uniref:hypothetical protein n=1 Tax=Ferruginibacter sp. SUN106 TaxID=2978348 RepID=UPI003D35E1DC